MYNSKKFFCLIFTLLVAFCSFSQERPRTLVFDDVQYSTIKKKPRSTRSEEVPSSASIKAYSPFPKNQGQYGTCTAWSTAYCATTIVNAIKNGTTDREAITNNAYSPAFLFRLLAPKDVNCQGSSSLSAALRVQKETGNLPISDVSESCIPAVSEAQIQKAAEGKIKDYARLFDVEAPAHLKILAVKKALSENRPVVLGMICPPSFDAARDVWKPKELADRKLYGGHAMCVVGYDDSKDGGAFEIQNSWGTKWGNEGYIWINYETFAAFTLYSFEIK